MVSSVSRTGRHLQKFDKGHRLVVGCIPYRYKTGGKSESSDNELVKKVIEVLVISSQNGQGMLFPKGGWELDESIEAAALRETREEAGVVGELDPCELGKWSYKSKSRGVFHEGHMFALLVTQLLETWPERHLRQRVWMNVEDAKEACQHKWMKEALDKLVVRLIPLRHHVGDQENCL